MTHVVAAEYVSLRNPLWSGNPLIEVLGDIAPSEAFIKYMARGVPYDESERFHSIEERLGYVSRLMHFFLPFEQHAALDIKFGRALRDGYIYRNPLDKTLWKRTNAELEDIKRHFKHGLTLVDSRPAIGFKITGMSGTGKSSAIAAVLSQYPQVIQHQNYNGKYFVESQLTWIKIECPKNGSSREICTSFFNEVDRLLHQTYSLKCIRPRGDAVDMMSDMAQVAAAHHLGALIIDEIQNLSNIRNQGSKVLMAFFTQLMNTLGIPIILIGTPVTNDILDSALHHIRRSSGQGEIVWERLKNSDDFDQYLDVLWQYQFTNKVCPLHTKLRETMFQESQGVIDFANKIYMISQELAITSGEEEITVPIIQQVAASNFGKAQFLFRLFQDKGNEIAESYIEEMKIDVEKIRKNLHLGVPLPQRSEEQLPLTPLVRQLPLGYEALKANNFIQSAIEFF